MYNLANGEKIRSFEKNGEENNRVGFQYSFTQEGKYFGYTSDKSFTVWSMNTGLQIRKIKNHAPIKLICGGYLICIGDDLICSFIKHRDGISDYEFLIRGVYSIDEILDCRVTIDMKYFIYVLEQGIIKYHINTGEFQGLQKFKPMDGKIKAVISPDCRYVVKTNMKYLNLYNLETQDTIGTILKEPFNEFKIDFENKKIITINDICINIHDYSKEKLPEKFVWLNKNPTHFIDIKFSKDFKILIGQIDNNNTVVYDCETGKVIRKFQNFEEDYSISCEVAPTTIANLTNIASKSGKYSISTFNYLNGREDNTFYGFNAYSFCFSDDGSLLAVGAKNGPEIARLYNVNSGQYVSFEFNGSNYNFHTVVNISSPKTDKLICCSIDQQPLIFDIRGELIFKCECKYHFEEIYEIESDSNYNIFLVKGRDTQKRNIAILYRLSDGIIIERYENYTAMNLALCRGYLVGKCENFCNNRLSTMCLHNINRPVRKVCQLQSDDYYFLNDYKGFVSKFGGDENIIYYIANVENGRVIAKVNYAKKSSRNAETHISVDPTRNELIFRYIELLPFEDTLFYRKQHIDKVNKDDFDEEKINFGNDADDNGNGNGYDHGDEMGGNDDEQGGFDNQNNQFAQNENENDGF
jgi:WD40 repeat protein